MLLMLLACSAPLILAKQTWVEAKDWNAIPTGAQVGAKSAEACQAIAVQKKANIFAFNLKSKHCYVKKGSHFDGLPSDHVDSGCIIEEVAGCKEDPKPNVPGLLPHWLAPQPDHSKPLGGYPKANVQSKSLVHRGTHELGT